LARDPLRLGFHRKKQQHLIPDPKSFLSYLTSGLFSDAADYALDALDPDLQFHDGGGGVEGHLVVVVVVTALLSEHSKSSSDAIAHMIHGKLTNSLHDTSFKATFADHFSSSSCFFSLCLDNLK
jgi:hypothetical protein